MTRLQPNPITTAALVIPSLKKISSSGVVFIGAAGQEMRFDFELPLDPAAAGPGFLANHPGPFTVGSPWTTGLVVCGFELDTPVTPGNDLAIAGYILAEPDVPEGDYIQIEVNHTDHSWATGTLGTPNGDYETLRRSERWEIYAVAVQSLVIRNVHPTIPVGVRFSFTAGAFK